MWRSVQEEMQLTYHDAGQQQSIEERIGLQTIFTEFCNMTGTAHGCKKQGNFTLCPCTARSDSGHESLLARLACGDAQPSSSCSTVLSSVVATSTAAPLTAFHASFPCIRTC